MPLPLDYYDLLSLAFETQPDAPWDAFDDLNICSFDLTPAHPNYRLSPDVYAEYSGTPAEGVVFAWSGIDGAHYVFVIDNEPESPTELPIARVCSDGCHRLMGLSFREFVSNAMAHLFEPPLPPEIVGNRTDIPPSIPWSDEESRLIGILKDRFLLDDPVFMDDDELHASLWKRRQESGAIRTEDGLGVKLPADSYDLETIEAQDWSHPDTEILASAETLLDNQPGTALVLARNFRHYFDYTDWNTERRFMPWTADILEAAYLKLDRRHAATKVRVQTTWALENLG